jgi:tetratricopeptide (TPR) repeat protein
MVSYWAFLSYCSGDHAVARWLQRALEAYVVPRRLVDRPTPAGPAPRRFRPVFRDRTDMAADADLAERIGWAIERSAYLIVICSPEAARSIWVEREIASFRTTHGDSRILALIVSGEPAGGPQDCFPAALRRRTGADAALTEPIAADLRPGGDGRRMALLKIVAGMLGIGLDELIRRDHQRRHRRMFAVTAGSIAAMAVMAVLATEAFIARNEAQKQRAHAEGLIEFMLTDLRKQLEPSGRLNLMDGVGREALKYYEAQLPRGLDAPSLARRARALRLMGEISVQRGDLAVALASFRQASDTTRELMRRMPDDGASIFNHAQNVFWVGEIARRRGELADAESAFRQYRILADRLTALDPENDDWRTEVAYADSALGVLLLQENRPVDASAAFQKTLEVDQELARRHPEDLNRQVEVGQGHAWLADALREQGRLADARRHRESELAIYQAVLLKDPNLRQAKSSSIVALHTLGRLAQLRGDLDGALVTFNDAASRAQALLDTERENMEVTSLAAIIEIDLGEALLAAGRVDAAKAAQQHGSALIATALGHDSSVQDWRDYRDNAALLEAAVASRSGQVGESLRFDQAVLGRLQGERIADYEPYRLWLLERARLQTGNDLAASGRPQEANDEWTAIVQSLSKPIETYEPDLLMVLKAADERLGRSRDALVIAQRLAALARS